MSQFIEMFKDKKTNGKITDLVDTDIKSVKKSFNKDDLIEYIDISSVNAKSRTLNETTQYIVSSAPSRAQQCVQNGDILVSTVRPINRNVAVVDRDLTNLVASTGFCVLRPKDGYREYLLSIVTSDRYTEKMCDIASGGLYPAVNNSDVLSYDIFIPDKDFLNQVTQIYRQADKSGFDGRKSQFIEMFGAVESTKPLTDFIEVSFPGEWGQEDKDGSGVKVIRTTNFTNIGKLDLSDVVTRDIDSVKVEKKKLSKGDIILERSGGTNENPVGRVVYFEEDGVYLFNNFTQLLRCKEGVNSLFIFYSLFNYYQMNKNVIRSMGNKTTGIQNLKMDRYWQIPIADVSIERQKEFESIYRQADKSGSDCYIHYHQSTYTINIA